MALAVALMSRAMCVYSACSVAFSDNFDGAAQVGSTKWGASAASCCLILFLWLFDLLAKYLQSGELPDAPCSRIPGITLGSLPLPGRESQIWGLSVSDTSKASAATKGWRPRAPSGRNSVCGTPERGEALQSGLSQASCVAVKSAKDGCSASARAPCPPPVRRCRSVRGKSQQSFSGQRSPISSSSSSIRISRSGSSDSSGRTGPRERARYGLRAERVGEASHPGPSEGRFVASVARLVLSLLVIVSCRIGGQQEATDKPPAQSYRSSLTRRERHREAKRRQVQRAKFEFQSPWASSRSKLSRGTCKLLNVPRKASWLMVMVSSGHDPRNDIGARVAEMPIFSFKSSCVQRSSQRFGHGVPFKAFGVRFPKIAARFGRHELARYGLRARRVGEASKPGPVFHQRTDVLRRLHQNALTPNVAGQLSEALPANRSRAAQPEGTVKDVARMLTSLARRAAQSGLSGGIPQCIQQQRWSSINVPLMWAASEQAEGHGILDWIGHVTANAQPIVSSNDASISIAEAVREGWSSLRTRLQAWDVNSREEFVGWAHRNGYNSVRLSEHIHSTCQEFILNKAVEEDLAVANLEIGYVALAMHLATMPGLMSEIQSNLSRRSPNSQQLQSHAAPAGSTATSSTADANTRRENNQAPQASAWAAMEALDLEGTLRQPARTVREVPRWFRGSMRQAFGLALRSRDQRNQAAWKLFVLAPRMLLRPTEVDGEAGKKIFFERFRRFQRGEWEALLAEAIDAARPRAAAKDAEAAREALRDGSERKVKIRELSRARALLTSSGLAPRTAGTLAQLTNNELRPRQLSAQIPADALSHRPIQRLELDRKQLLGALRRAGRGSAPDLAGMRYEHVRVLLEDDELWALFCDLAQDFARADVPEAVMHALRMGRMTALNKKDNKVRGIVAGSVLRRLVCKTVAKQYSDEFMARTAPFQFALQTKAGTDALAHVIRFLTDRDEDTVVASLDGIGAFDHVRRAAFFEKLLACEELRPLLPLVSALYGTTSRFLWEDESGDQVVIEQAEGGEQGCPLMPALFALAQHDALAEANESLLPDEHIFAFLDDLYVIASKARAGEALQEVAWKVETRAGVRSHTGKLRAWCKRGGPAPSDVQDISEDAWTADLPDEENGIVILGTPLGRPAFVEKHAAERMETENKMLHELPGFKDIQAAWSLLLYSAVPRANHTIRVLPPSQSTAYAKSHDDAVWRTFCRIFGAEEHQEDTIARKVASLPGCLGGLGLRSAERTAEAAHWASWVDALAVLASKAPRLAALIVTDLERDDGPATSCLREVASARGRLLELGAEHVPSWQDALAGVDPPEPEKCIDTDLDFARGWQWYASSARETFFAERVLQPICEAPQRAMLLSQGGSGGAWLRAIPSEKAFEFQPLRFQVAVRRRLRWPLPLASHRCRGQTCRQAQDDRGDHAASCNRSGLLKLRSRPIEKMWARILREGGARVRENVTLHDAGVPVDPQDGRNIEIVASGLSIHQGIPLAIDATMVSPLHADGTPHQRADERPGVALGRGRHVKERTYPELLTSSRLRLITAGVETGGRLSKEALDLLAELASFRTRSEPQALRGSIARAWRSRWTVMLSVTCQDALVATLVDDGVSFLDAVCTGSPSSTDVWLDDA